MSLKKNARNVVSKLSGYQITVFAMIAEEKNQKKDLKKEKTCIRNHNFSHSGEGPNNSIWNNFSCFKI